MSAQILALLESPENEHFVIDCLELSGHKVLIARTFPQAILIVQGLPVDLIISDVHLENGGNVFDFLKWVKTRPLTTEIPFVLLSCNPTILAKYLEDGIKTSARMLGAAKYIRMDTFDCEQFRLQIDSVIPPSINKKLIHQTDESKPY